MPVAFLARALDDPGLELAFWLPDAQRYVGTDGHPVERPAGDSARAVTTIEHEGAPVAALIHDAALGGELELVSPQGEGTTLRARLPCA